VATYTIDTDQVEEAGLRDVTASYNVEQRAVNPDWQPLTTQDYLRARNKEILASLARERMSTIAQQALGAYPSLTDDQKTQILGLLGMSSYISLPLEAQLEALGIIGLSRFMNLTRDEMNQIFALVGVGT
jgi:hypothetical protein